MMRNGQNKRMRGRNRNNNNNNNNHNHNRGHHHNPLTRVYESNGPDVKIRGTAHHVAEKYLQLARDASSVGDHVTAEAHHQHAEHYFRLIAAAQEQFRQQNPHYQPQPVQAQTDDNRDGMADEGDGTGQPAPIPQSFGNQQNFPQREQPQPYVAPQQQPYGGQQQPPRPQHQPQPYQQQPQPQQQPQQAQPNFGGGDVGGLPSFITGGQAPQAPQYGANGHDNSQGGQGGQGDRFPMHRRRRRHRGPHNPQQPDTRGDAPDAPGND